jgi:phospholipase C
MRSGALGSLLLVALAACDGGVIGAVTEADARRGPAPDARPAVDSGPSAIDAPAKTNIEHVVLIVQENHTFDAYFGSYCTAPAGSAPACTDGPACCEAAPDTVPGPGGARAAPVVLDDAENGRYSPDHSRACELLEIHGGAMDRFVTGTSCSSAHNFAVAPAATVSVYRDYAQRGALADRYFQPIVGATSANDMYLSVARRLFDDNAYQPPSLGSQCVSLPKMGFDAESVADLLLANGHSFGAYIEGYGAVLGGRCGAAPSDCPAHRASYPCIYDPSDIPFQYDPRLMDDPALMHDFAQLGLDLDGGTLPDVAFVKALGYHTEHPAAGTTIAAGMAFVDAIVQAVAGSSYASSTLILVTWDEGGGYFDHVRPPPSSAVDGAPYGTRVPLLALGRFARPGVVTHVVLEHSSIVRLIELNFLGATGQLGARDAVAGDLGSLLDPAQTGIVIPE